MDIKRYYQLKFIIMDLSKMIERPSSKEFRSLIKSYEWNIIKRSLSTGLDPNWPNFINKVQEQQRKISRIMRVVFNNGKPHQKAALLKTLKTQNSESNYFVYPGVRILYFDIIKNNPSAIRDFIKDCDRPLDLIDVQVENLCQKVGKEILEVMFEKPLKYGFERVVSDLETFELYISKHELSVDFMKVLFLSENNDCYKMYIKKYRVPLKYRILKILGYFN